MTRYSAKQRRMRGIGGRSKRQFIRFFTNVKRSKAYHGLSRTARALLFELLDRYTGINNGMIGLGVREAEYELGCGRATVCRVMDELDDSGLAHPTKLGSRLGKKATEWRLTFLRCDLSGELPRNEWEQRERFCEFHSRTTKGPFQNSSGDVNSISEPQTPKSSMNASEVRSKVEPHIDIYQGEGCAGEGTGTAPSEVSPPPDTESKKVTQNNFGPSRRAS